MRTQYITAARYWNTRNGVAGRGRVELQLEPEIDEGGCFPDTSTMTGLQVFSTRTGDPMSGITVLDPKQLLVLFKAIGRRLEDLSYVDPSEVDFS